MNLVGKATGLNELIYSSPEKWLDSAIKVIPVHGFYTFALCSWNMIFPSQENENNKQIL